jgi:hypothetical protein
VDEFRDNRRRYVFATEWGVGQVLWSMIWFTLFFIWIWLVITVFADIFRSHDLGGVSKFLWVLFIIFLPYLGVFVYLIARGGKMGQNAAEEAQRRDEAMRGYIRSTVDTPTGASDADELTKLVSLRDKGVIDEAEFMRMKAKITGVAAAAPAAGDVRATART